MEPGRTDIESYGIHFLHFGNVEVFEHLDVVLSCNRKTPSVLESKGITPLQSPLVQGGTLDESTRVSSTCHTKRVRERYDGAS